MTPTHGISKSTSYSNIIKLLFKLLTNIQTCLSPISICDTPEEGCLKLVEGRVRRKIRRLDLSREQKRNQYRSACPVFAVRIVKNCSSMGNSLESNGVYGTLFQIEIIDCFCRLHHFCLNHNVSIYKNIVYSM
jgi:hypothetical protein